jgi:4-amino-4-deoxy-L-arabinose transferase-like glycosyltransferase
MHFFTPELDTDGPPQRAGTEFPIYSYLIALLYSLFGVHEILGRLLSCLFAAWGAVFLFLFVRPRLGERVAFWSAIVMCSLPIHIYFTRTVQPEPMALWGLLGFLYYADRSWILALLLGSLAPLLKLSFLYVLFPLWFFFGYEREGWKILKDLKWIGLMTGILVLAQAWYHYAKTAPTGVLPLSAKEHIENLKPVLTWNLWRAQFISRIPELVLTYSGIVLAGVGFYQYGRERSARFFLAWIGVGALYIPLLGQYGLFHRYTLLPLAPIAAVWIACGISALMDRAHSRPALKAALCVLLIGIPVHAGFRIAHWYRVEYRYLYPLHDFLAPISRPEDLILTSTHERPVHLYYLDHYGYSVEPPDWKPSDVDGFIAHGVRFILIPTEDNVSRLAEWKSCLASRAELIKEEPEYLLYRTGWSTSVPARHG